MTMTSNDTAGGEAMRVLFDRLSLGLRTAIPCVVEAVSGDGTAVDVVPAVSLAQRLDGAVVPIAMPVLRGVPVQLLGSTSLGLFVAVPITAGDDGLLVIADRALDNWQHGAGILPPPDMQTPRHHDATDAVYIPGLQRLSGALTGYPTDAVQLRNRAGTCIAELAQSRVSVRVPGGAVMEIEGDTVAITGKLVVSESISAPSIRADGDELAHHLHGGVDRGTASTDPL